MGPSCLLGISFKDHPDATLNRPIFLSRVPIGAWRSPLSSKALRVQHMKFDDSLFSFFSPQLTVGFIKSLTSILLFDVFIFMGRLNALGTFHRFRSPFVCFWIAKWSRLLVWGRVVFSRLASRITKIQTHVSHMSVKSPYRRVAIPPYPQRPSGFNIWRLMVIPFIF